MFEINLLSLIINNCATLNVRKDKQHYRLDFNINKSKIYNLELNQLVNKVTKEIKFLYNTKSNRYYLHGHNAIKALELFKQLHIINYFPFEDFNDKAATILRNKELFTRSTGKPYSEEERNRLEELYQQFNAN